MALTVVPWPSGIVEIPIGKLRVSPTNPRKANPSLQGSQFRALVDSIRTQGVLNPLLVVDVGDGFEIVCGYRRFTAARRLKLESLPCIVRSLTLLEQLEVGLVDNLNRSRLDPVDTGYALLSLLEQGLSQAKIAERIGRSQSYVSRYLLLTALPAATQKQIKAKKVTVDAALGYGQVPRGVFELDEELQQAWAGVREAALGLGNRHLLNQLSAFARAWQAFQAVARQERRPA